MVRLSSTAEVVRALSTARDVTVLSYTLRPGPVRAALESAARRGARVRVRLEGAPFSDAKGALARSNRRIVAELASCGADASLAHVNPTAGEAPVHAKALVADGRLFLDNRNFGSGDFIVKDDRPADACSVLDAFAGKPRNERRVAFAIEKGDALEREAELLQTARPGADAIVQSETFGYGAIYSALDALGKAGAAPRLLVSDREARPRSRERQALERLAADGVCVRLCRDSEKFAVVGTRAWIGSANASPAFGDPPVIDWGIGTSDRRIVAAVRDRVESRWATAKPLKSANG